VGGRGTREVVVVKDIIVVVVVVGLGMEVGEVGNFSVAHHIGSLAVQVRYRPWARAVPGGGALAVVVAWLAAAAAAGLLGGEEADERVKVVERLVAEVKVLPQHCALLPCTHGTHAAHSPGV
jgi:hypothetical protein